MFALKEILYRVALNEVIGNTSVDIVEIVFDSRKVASGVLFVALRGTLSDGHDFIEGAIHQGARVILCEQLPEAFKEGVTYLKVPDSHEALGTMAANRYDHPSAHLKLVGVTGTNGKTTCATLLFQLFSELGFACGLISTVRNLIHNKVVEASHTTPDALAINRLLREMVEAKCDYCFMEVSSHAIVQKRIAGLNFAGGIFTNITHDHLDFHKTFANYIHAKQLFFTGLNKSAFALTNADDKNGMVMVQNSRAYVKTYGIRNMADYKAKIMESQFSGMLLHVDGVEAWFKMIGGFNAYNLLAVYSTAMLLEQNKLKVLTIMSKLVGAEGRFEYVMGPKSIIGIVDYAHTPDAVENVLRTINAIRTPKQNVITVIGCGGDRDKTKRPEMAQVACDGSSKVIFTSDNPRSEDPGAIIADMEMGIPASSHGKTLSIADRKAAIRTACHLATEGDIVLLAGKGHEKYQEIKGVKHPFDDKKELTDAFDDLVNEPTPPR